MINSTDLLKNLRNNAITCDDFCKLIEKEPIFAYKDNEESDFLTMWNINDNPRIPFNGLYVLFDGGRIAGFGINDINQNDRLLLHTIETLYFAKEEIELTELVANALEVEKKDNKVLEYIRTNIWFSLIPVENLHEREEIQILLIELFAKHSWQNASKSWLGSKDSSDNIVWASGLWHKKYIPTNLTKIKIKSILEKLSFGTWHDFVDDKISMLKDYKKCSNMPTPLSPEDIEKYRKDIDNGRDSWALMHTVVSHGFDVRRFTPIAKAVLEEGLFDEL